MKLYMIEPEVSGEIGENTIYENYDAFQLNNADITELVEV